MRVWILNLYNLLQSLNESMNVTFFFPSWKSSWAQIIRSSFSIEENCHIISVFFLFYSLNYLWLIWYFYFFTDLKNSHDVITVVNLFTLAFFFSLNIRNLLPWLTHPSPIIRLLCLTALLHRFDSNKKKKKISQSFLYDMHLLEFLLNFFLILISIYSTILGLNSPIRFEKESKMLSLASLRSAFGCYQHRRFYYEIWSFLYPLLCWKLNISYIVL